MRNRLTVAGAVVAAFLGLLFALVAVVPSERQLPGPRAGLVVAGVVAVLVASALVIGRRAGAARRAAWFAVPAALLGAVWWWAPRSAFGWFAYAPLTAVTYDGPRRIDLLLPALVLLLGVLATTGIVTLLGDESPVRALAVVAITLTAPLWVPPGPRITLAGLPLVGDPVTASVAAVRTVALLLVIVVGVAVLVAGRPAPARATAYVVPALGLTWVWWQTAAGSVVGFAGNSAAPRPTVIDTLPWTVTAVAETLLVTVLWVLAVLGLRELVSPSGR
jgi:hypothetical protein